MDLDHDVDGALVAIVGLLSELQRDGELGLHGKNRVAFSFHITESKLAIVKACAIIDPNSITIRRLIKGYMRFLVQLSKEDGGPGAS